MLLFKPHHLCFVRAAMLCVLLHAASSLHAITFVPDTIAVTSRHTRIDASWRFALGDFSHVTTNPDAAASWRCLDLPHDWSVEPDAAAAAGDATGPFSRKSIGGYQTGHTVGGEAWYAKSFVLDESSLGDTAIRHWLHFEGVYNECELWVNGQLLCTNHYGYMPFRADISAALRRGRNDIAVRVLNQGSNTRWYAGSGIYRHVWLVAAPCVWADEWETLVDTETDAVSTTVHNDSGKPQTATVSVAISDAGGNVVATAQRSQRIKGGSSWVATVPFAMAGRHMWTTATPYLYTATISITTARGKMPCTLRRTFGYRTISYSPTDGLRISGQPTLLRGGCIHHDNGLLGAAAYDRAEERKIELLLQQGYNAIRCSHNLPSEHLLDVCDSLGMMVIDETFDQWLRQKNADDYHRHFATHAVDDIATMVRRDRHHPSVIMWSIGNEIPGRIEPDGLRVAAQLRQAVRSLDATRPITAAICSWDEGDGWNAAGHDWARQDSLAFTQLDIGGYNYLCDRYADDHRRHPSRVMVGTESYPKEMGRNWQMVEQMPYLIGDFVWTAMDYLGEAGIGSAAIREHGGQSMFQPWPWFNGWCGDIDITGQKKPQSYYHDVVWRRAPIAMAVEQPVPAGHHQSISAWGWQLEELSWTFAGLTECDTMTVNVYSRAPQVRLYLNNECMGTRSTSQTFWAAFRVPYRRGTLRAVNTDAAGQETGESVALRTTGRPVAVRLTTDRHELRPDGQDLAFVTIEAVDAQGNVVTSDSDTRLSISLTGAATLLAAGNASPTDMQSFCSATPRLYRGRALAIVRSNTATHDAAGTAINTATLAVTTEDATFAATAQLTINIADH